MFKITCAVVFAFAMIWSGLSIFVGHRPDDHADHSADATVNRPDARAGETPRSPLSGSFLNAQHGELVGSTACESCHSLEFENFRRTGMGQSLVAVDPRTEPADGILEHSLSGRRYEIYRRDGALRHRELLTGTASEGPAPGSREVVLADVPLLWRVGSGTHARTYLTELDGFLTESPVTWYQATRSWGLSPGYDNARHDGFSRPINSGCLNCHAGQVHELSGSLHRVSIVEPCISCEQCHGPGSLHTAARLQADSGRNAVESPDPTIVNPKFLTRDLADDICARCHHRPAATVDVPGRGAAAFRPGLPLAAFRVDFDVQGSAGTMSVVGHTGQLRLSECYQQSDLSCVRCHDPHERLPVESRSEHYRSVCLSCHNENACGLETVARRRESADDNCIQCHMPSADTEVAHVAFTHHRIGIHLPESRHHESTQRDLRDGAVAREQEGGEPFFTPADVLPQSDLSWLTTAEQTAVRAAAVFKLGKELRDARRQDEFGRMAFDGFVTAWNQGLRDPRLTSQLALLAQTYAPEDVPMYAQPCLADRDATGAARSDAVLALAGYHAMRREFEPALRFAKQLTQIRREASDQVLIARIYQARGDAERASKALEQAIAIDPMLTGVRNGLIQYYQQTGNTARMHFHLDRSTGPRPTQP